MSASGGGVVDVAAFALRIACLTLRKPALRKVLILDEPFRFLSAEYRPRVRSLIESLADEFGVQFIIVTHLDEFRCGKVITLSEI
jgi:ABC-type sulfate/molybdate transport systems ATPase subunit